MYSKLIKKSLFISLFVFITFITIQCFTLKVENTRTGDIIEIEVSSTDTIGSIKEKLKNLIDGESTLLVIRHDYKDVSDATKLSDLGIDKDTSEVSLMLDYTIPRREELKGDHNKTESEDLRTVMGAYGVHLADPSASKMSDSDARKFARRCSKSVHPSVMESLAKQVGDDQMAKLAHMLKDGSLKRADSVEEPEKPNVTDTSATALS